MTLSAVMTTREVADTISRGEAGVLMHGPTFMANPLACAVAVASLKLLRDRDMEARVKEIERILKEELAPAAGRTGVRDVRVLGSIGVIEMEEPVDVGEFQKRCVKSGVWIRPFGRNVYVMPPYVISEDQLRRLCRVMIDILP